MSRLIRTMTAIAALLLVGPTGTASAQNIWTAFGNTGVVDETGRSIYVFNSAGSAAIEPSVSSATLELRYNVTGVSLIPATTTPPGDDSDLESQNCIRLDAKLRDTGSGARVIVRVQELDQAGGSGGSGSIRTLGTIDSDQSSLASPEYIMYSTCLNVPPGNFPLDMAFHAYVVEVQLIKTTVSANPGLKLLRLCSRGACTP
jgi:hypothetical protein